MSVWTTSKPTSAHSRTKIVTRPNLSVPLNGEIVWKCRIGLFGTRAICSCMWEAVLKLTMDYKMTKHMLNNCTLKESRTWLLVCTRHCYFIPFNHEHPVYQFPGASTTGEGGRGVTTPAFLKTAGVDPPEIWIFQYLFSWNLYFFPFSIILKVKWPKSEEKLNFRDRMVWVPMNLTPPPNQNFVVTASLVSPIIICRK